jgi:phosphoribosylformylglycinamidine synthase subunit PurQ / glutaminase
MKPRAIVLSAPGTNRQYDAEFALVHAGAEVAHVDIRDLPENVEKLASAQLIVVAGGFSYADALGSARVFAMELEHRVGDVLQQKATAGTPIIGICNGFQMLVRAGLLPGVTVGTAALTHNERNTFECRWVTLSPSSQRCIWTQGLSDLIACPIAHGEGRFVCDSETLKALQKNDHIAFRYVQPDGGPAGGQYPINPNGSIDDIAGICDDTGLVLGMMPHPENHVIERQGRSIGTDRLMKQGLAINIFRSGVNYAAQG